MTPRPPRDRFDPPGHAGDDGDMGPGGGGGGFGGGLRRVFSGGGGFFDWALPLYTAFGIKVRIHLMFILFLIVSLITAFANGRLLSSSMAMGGLFLIVLLHEYGHCFACRRVGGEADDILMWPLGGLASCRPPHNWRDELITVVGGPLVNVLLVPVFAGILLALGGGWSVAVFNPLDPFTAWIESGLNGRGAELVWWLHYTNAVMLAFNVLLPMYPLDGGRIWQCVLWRSLGWRRSLAVSTTVGIACAIAVGIYGMLTTQGLLMGIALFAGLTCYQQKLHLAASDPALDEDSPFAESLRWRESAPGASDSSETLAKKAAATKEKAAADAAELDRILGKIAKDGMGNLTRREKAFLSKETQRKRVN